MTPPTYTNIPIQVENTPTPVYAHNFENSQPRNQSLLPVIGGVLGIIISIGVIVWGLSKAFFVTKEEYSAKVVRDVTDQISMDKKLDSVAEALRRQEAAFDKLLSQVQRLQDEIGRKR